MFEVCNFYLKNKIYSLKGFLNKKVAEKYKMQNDKIFLIWLQFLLLFFFMFCVKFSLLVIINLLI